MLDIFRSKRAKPKSALLSESDEDASSALIAHTNNTTNDAYVVSETYVVPDINGAFPTDLSDSDDDFFEKKCDHCGGAQSVLVPCNCIDLLDEADLKDIKKHKPKSKPRSVPTKKKCDSTSSKDTSTPPKSVKPDKNEPEKQCSDDGAESTKCYTENDANKVT